MTDDAEGYSVNIEEAAEAAARRFAKDVLRLEAELEAIDALFPGGGPSRLEMITDLMAFNKRLCAYYDEAGVKWELLNCMDTLERQLAKANDQLKLLNGERAEMRKAFQEIAQIAEGHF